MRIPLCRQSFLLALVLLAVSGACAAAQGTALVPPTDLAYQDLDRLAELGMLDSVIVGQRPYSRREIGRIIRRVRDRLDQVGQRRDETRVNDEAAMQVNGIVERLSARFNDEVEGRELEGPQLTLFDGLALSGTSTDAVRRGFPAPFSRPLEAAIDPLPNPRRLGPPAVRGQSTALELSQRLEATSWLSFYARERLEYRWPRDSALTRTRGDLLLAGMRARYRNLALSVGREQFAWSQGEGDGLFLASDAPALDQVSLAGDHPFVMPGFLRFLGPTQATLILANLGPTRVRSHSQLLTYKVSVNPASSFELGATFMNHFGGSGGRSSTFGNRLVDFLPFVDIFRRHNYTDTTATLDVDSDKLLGLDGRLRLDRLGGLLITGELLIDDFDIHRLPYLLTGYGSSTLGIVIPQIGSPALSLKLSAKHMGILTYTHSALSGGITTRGRLLGDELGPDAKAFGGELRWIPAPALRLSVSGRSAQYSNAEYGVYYSDSAQTRYHVYKIRRTANELRDRFLGAIEVQSEAGVSLVLRGGLERIRNADFVGDRRKSYVAEAALRIRQ